MIDNIMDTSIEEILTQYHHGRDNQVTVEEHQQVHNALRMAYLKGRDRGTIQHPTYARIDLEGPTGTYAILQRPPGGDTIDVKVLLPRFQATVSAESPLQQVVVAQELHKRMESQQDNPRSWEHYLRPLEHLFGNYCPGEIYHE